MAWTVAAPAARAALFAAVSTALGTGTTAVRNGRTLSGSKKDEAIVIGYSPDGAVIEHQLQIDDLGGGSDQDQFVIWNMIEVTRGASDGLQDATDRAYELLSAVGDVLIADRQLDDTVMLAWIAEAALTEALPKGAGALAQIYFSVACLATD